MHGLPHKQTPRDVVLVCVGEGNGSACHPEPHPDVRERGAMATLSVWWVGCSHALAPACHGLRGFSRAETGGPAWLPGSRCGQFS
eukprot:356031-Chlamydomonas_euryale.AAC.3